MRSIATVLALAGALAAAPSYAYDDSAACEKATREHQAALDDLARAAAASAARGEEHSIASAYDVVGARIAREAACLCPAATAAFDTDSENAVDEAYAAIGGKDAVGDIRAWHAAYGTAVNAAFATAQSTCRKAACRVAERTHEAARKAHARAVSAAADAEAAAEEAFAAALAALDAAFMATTEARARASDVDAREVNVAALAEAGAAFMEVLSHPWTPPADSDARETIVAVIAKAHAAIETAIDAGAVADEARKEADDRAGFSAATYAAEQARAEACLCPAAAAAYTQDKKIAFLAATFAAADAADEQFPDARRDWNHNYGWTILNGGPYTPTRTGWNDAYDDAYNDAYARAIDSAFATAKLYCEGGWREAFSGSADEDEDLSTGCIGGVRLGSYPSRR